MKIVDLKSHHQIFLKPTAGNGSGFFLFRLMNNTTTQTGGLDRVIFQIAPTRNLVNLLEELTSLYEEAGLPAAVAREAALADLECSFTILPLAA